MKKFEIIQRRIKQFKIKNRFLSLEKRKKRKKRKKSKQENAISNQKEKILGCDNKK